MKLCIIIRTFSKDILLFVVIRGDIGQSVSGVEMEHFVLPVFTDASYSWSKAD